MIPETAWPLFMADASPRLSLESNIVGWESHPEPVILVNARAEGTEGTCCE